MTDDYAALVARLRDIADRVDAGDVFEIHGSTGLREAANVIEWLDPDAERNSWRNSEIRKLQERVRELEAVEKAAREAATMLAYVVDEVAALEYEMAEAADLVPVMVKATADVLADRAGNARDFLERHNALRGREVSGE